MDHLKDAKFGSRWLPAWLAPLAAIAVRTTGIMRTRSTSLLVLAAVLAGTNVGQTAENLPPSGVPQRDLHPLLKIIWSRGPNLAQGLQDNDGGILHGVAFQPSRVGQVVKRGRRGANGEMFVNRLRVTAREQQRRPTNALA